MSDADPYLLAVYSLERSDGPPVASGAVARKLDRSPAAATEAIQRLESRGLVEYEPYEGASLTPDGRERARELYDTYETLRRFFRTVLDIEDHEDEALRLVGAVSPRVADRLDATLLADGSGPGEEGASDGADGAAGTDDAQTGEGSSRSSPPESS